MWPDLRIPDLELCQTGVMVVFISPAFSHVVIHELKNQEVIFHTNIISTIHEGSLLSLWATPTSAPRLHLPSPPTSITLAAIIRELIMGQELGTIVILALQM